MSQRLSWLLLVTCVSHSQTVFMESFANRSSSTNQTRPQQRRDESYRCTEQFITPLHYFSQRSTWRKQPCCSASNSILVAGEVGCCFAIECWSLLLPIGRYQYWHHHHRTYYIERYQHTTTIIEIKLPAGIPACPIAQLCTNRIRQRSLQVTMWWIATKSDGCSISGTSVYLHMSMRGKRQ